MAGCDRAVRFGGLAATVPGGRAQRPGRMARLTPGYGRAATWATNTMPGYVRPAAQAARRAAESIPSLTSVEFPAVFISSAFAQTAPAATATGGGLMGSLTGMLPLVLMFVVLYFIMIRPQMKRQKEHRAMIEAIAKGDEVVTSGGLLGRVSRLSEGYLHIEIASGVEVQVQRSAVAQVLPKGTLK